MFKENTLERVLQETKKKNIVCFGAGKLANRFLKEQKELENKVLCFIDNSKQLQQEGLIIEGKKYPVYSIEYLGQLKEEETVIVITSRFYKQMMDQIREGGFDHFEQFIYPFTEPRFEVYKKQCERCYRDFGKYEEWDQEKIETYTASKLSQIKQEGDHFVLPYLPVFLTSRCTLNCEHCNNLMPYYKEKAQDYSTERIIESLDKILSAVEEMVFCELVGGEPFLYKNICTILDYVGRQKKISQIIMVTNATVIPDQEVIEKLKEYNVIVRVSDYGLLKKAASFVETMEHNGVRVRILQDMSWSNPGGIEKRNRAKEEIKFQYNKCMFSMRCKYLYLDKIFTCARAASLYAIGAAAMEQDQIDVMEGTKEELTKRLKEFYLSDYGEACDYCDLHSFDGGEEIMAAQQSGRELFHSAYTIISCEELCRLRNK